MLKHPLGIEIGGGLGQFAGKVWRIGLMGHSCRRKTVFLLLAALETVIKADGYRVKREALDAAAEIYHQVG